MYSVNVAKDKTSAFYTINDAIEAVKDIEGPVEIIVNEGTYEERINL